MPPFFMPAAMRLMLYACHRARRRATPLLGQRCASSSLRAASDSLPVAAALRIAICAVAMLVQAVVVSVAVEMSICAALPPCCAAVRCQHMR